MSLRPALLAACVALVSACGASQPPPGSRTRLRLDVGDTTIPYTVVLPDDFERGRRYPVLLALPPGGQGQEE